MHSYGRASMCLSQVPNNLGTDHVQLHQELVEQIYLIILLSMVCLYTFRLMVPILARTRLSKIKELEYLNQIPQFLGKTRLRKKTSKTYTLTPPPYGIIIVMKQQFSTRQGNKKTVNFSSSKGLLWQLKQKETEFTFCLIFLPILPKNTDYLLFKMYA